MLTCKRFNGLGRSELNPSRDNNEPIRFAAMMGKSNSVRYLLSDNRVDPTAEQNFAIRFACQNGHHLVVRELLKVCNYD